MNVVEEIFKSIGASRMGQFLIIQVLQMFPSVQAHSFLCLTICQESWATNNCITKHRNLSISGELLSGMDNNANLFYAATTTLFLPTQEPTAISMKSLFHLLLNSRPMSKNPDLVMVPTSIQSQVITPLLESITWLRETTSLMFTILQIQWLLNISNISLIEIRYQIWIE